MDRVNLQPEIPCCKRSNVERPKTRNFVSHRDLLLAPLECEFIGPLDTNECDRNYLKSSLCPYRSIYPPWHINILSKVSLSTCPSPLRVTRYAVRFSHPMSEPLHIWLGASASSIQLQERSYLEALEIDLGSLRCMTAPRETVLAKSRIYGQNYSKTPDFSIVKRRLVLGKATIVLC